MPDRLPEMIAVYLFVINAAAFFVYGADKRKAERNRWRIPEAALIMLAVLGGTIGALGGMLAFRHKTKKPKFVIGVPLILLVQTAAAIFIIMRFGMQ